MSHSAASSSASRPARPQSAAARLTYPRVRSPPRARPASSVGVRSSSAARRDVVGRSNSKGESNSSTAAHRNEGGLDQQERRGTDKPGTSRSSSASPIHRSSGAAASPSSARPMLVTAVAIDALTKTVIPNASLKVGFRVDREDGLMVSMPPVAAAAVSGILEADPPPGRSGIARIEAPGYTARTLKIRARHDFAVGEVTMLPLACRACGRVVDSDSGHGIRNARVHLVGGPKPCSVVTFENGFFGVDVIPGKYTLTVSSDGCVATEQPVDLPRGEELVALGDINVSHFFIPVQFVAKNWKGVVRPEPNRLPEGTEVRLVGDFTNIAAELDRRTGAAEAQVHPLDMYHAVLHVPNFGQIGKQLRPTQTEMAFDCQNLRLLTVPVKFQVKDRATKRGLRDVAVAARGNLITHSAITGAAGFFELHLPNCPVSLSFKRRGYESAVLDWKPTDADFEAAAADQKQNPAALLRGSASSSLRRGGGATTGDGISRQRAHTPSTRRQPWSHSWPGGIPPAESKPRHQTQIEKRRARVGPTVVELNVRGVHLEGNIVFESDHCRGVTPQATLLAVDNDGEPLPGATSVMLAVQATADGGVLKQQTHPGRFKLKVSTPGCRTVENVVELIDEDTTGDSAPCIVRCDTRLHPAEVSCMVVVRSPSGVPVEGAAIRATDAKGTVDAPRTNASGISSFTLVSQYELVISKGADTLRVAPPGPEWDRSVLVDATLGLNGAEGVFVEHEAWLLRPFEVSVVDRMLELPVPGAVVTIDDGLNVREMTTADETGVAEFDDDVPLWAHQVRVTVAGCEPVEGLACVHDKVNLPSRLAPGYDEDSRKNAGRIITARDSSIKVAVARQNIHVEGKIVSEDGVSMGSSATLTFAHKQAPQSAKSCHRTCKSEANGSFNLDIYPGQYDVTVEAQGCEARTFEVALHHADDALTLREVTVTMHRCKCYLYSVVDGRRPADGAVVSVNGVLGSTEIEVDTSGQVAFEYAGSTMLGVKYRDQPAVEYVAPVPTASRDMLLVVNFGGTPSTEALQKLCAAGLVPLPRGEIMLTAWDARKSAAIPSATVAVAAPGGSDERTLRATPQGTFVIRDTPLAGVTLRVASPMHEERLVPLKVDVKSLAAGRVAIGSVELRQAKLKLRGKITAKNERGYTLPLASDVKMQIRPLQSQGNNASASLRLSPSRGGLPGTLLNSSLSQDGDSSDQGVTIPTTQIMVACGFDDPLDGEWRASLDDSQHVDDASDSDGDDGEKPVVRSPSSQKSPRRRARPGTGADSSDSSSADDDGDDEEIGSKDDDAEPDDESSGSSASKDGEDDDSSDSDFSSVDGSNDDDDSSASKKKKFPAPKKAKKAEKAKSKSTSARSKAKPPKAAATTKALPSPAKKNVVNKRANEATDPGEYMMALEPGEYTIELTALGYVPYKSAVKVESRFVDEDFVLLAHENEALVRVVCAETRRALPRAAVTMVMANETSEVMANEYGMATFTAIGPTTFSAAADAFARASLKPKVKSDGALLVTLALKPMVHRVTLVQGVTVATDARSHVKLTLDKDATKAHGRVHNAAVRNVSKRGEVMLLLPGSESLCVAPVTSDSKLCATVQPNLRAPHSRFRITQRPDASFAIETDVPGVGTCALTTPRASADEPCPPQGTVVTFEPVIFSDQRQWLKLALTSSAADGNIKELTIKSLAGDALTVATTDDIPAVGSRMVWSSAADNTARKASSAASASSSTPAASFRLYHPSEHLVADREHVVLTSAASSSGLRVGVSTRTLFTSLDAVNAGGVMQVFSAAHASDLSHSSIAAVQLTPVVPDRGAASKVPTRYSPLASTACGIVAAASAADERDSAFVLSPSGDASSTSVVEVQHRKTSLLLTAPSVPTTNAGLTLRRRRAADDGSTSASQQFRVLPVAIAALHNAMCELRLPALGKALQTTNDGSAIVVGSATDRAAPRLRLRLVYAAVAGDSDDDASAWCALVGGNTTAATKYLLASSDGELVMADPEAMSSDWEQLWFDLEYVTPSSATDVSTSGRKHQRPTQPLVRLRDRSTGRSLAVVDTSAKDEDAAPSSASSTGSDASSSDDESSSERSTPPPQQQRERTLEFRLATSHEQTVCDAFDLSAGHEPAAGVASARPSPNSVLVPRDRPHLALTLTIVEANLSDGKKTVLGLGPRAQAAVFDRMPQGDGSWKVTLASTSKLPLAQRLLLTAGNDAHGAAVTLAGPAMGEAAKSQLLRFIARPDSSTIIASYAAEPADDSKLLCIDINSGDDQALSWSSVSSEVAKKNRGSGLSFDVVALPAIVTAEGEDDSDSTTPVAQEAETTTAANDKQQGADHTTVVASSADDKSINIKTDDGTEYRLISVAAHGMALSIVRGTSSGDGPAHVQFATASTNYMDDAERFRFKRCKASDGDGEAWVVESVVTDASAHPVCLQVVARDNDAHIDGGHTISASVLPEGSSSNAKEEDACIPRSHQFQVIPAAGTTKNAIPRVVLIGSARLLDGEGHETVALRVPTSLADDGCKDDGDDEDDREPAASSWPPPPGAEVAGNDPVFVFELEECPPPAHSELVDGGVYTVTFEGSQTNTDEHFSLAIHSTAAAGDEGNSDDDGTETNGDEDDDRDSSNADDDGDDDDDAASSRDENERDGDSAADDAASAVADVEVVAAPVSAELNQRFRVRYREDGSLALVPLSVTSSSGDGAYALGLQFAEARELSVLKPLQDDDSRQSLRVQVANRYRYAVSTSHGAVAVVEPPQHGELLRSSFVQPPIGTLRIPINDERTNDPMVGAKVTIHDGFTKRTATTAGARGIATFPEIRLWSCRVTVQRKFIQRTIRRMLEINNGEDTGGKATTGNSNGDDSAALAASGVFAASAKPEQSMVLDVSLAKQPTMAASLRPSPSRVPGALSSTGPVMAVPPILVRRSKVAVVGSIVWALDLENAGVDGARISIHPKPPPPPPTAVAEGEESPAKPKLTPNLPPPVASRTTKADGSFSAKLDPGEYIVFITHKWANDSEAEIAVPIRDTIKSKQYRLKPIRADGKPVRRAGKILSRATSRPVKDSAVIWVPQSEFGGSAVAMTGETGAHEFTDVPGPYNVTIKRLFQRNADTVGMKYNWYARPPQPVYFTKTIPKYPVLPPDQRGEDIELVPLPRCIVTEDMIEGRDRHFIIVIDKSGSMDWAGTEMSKRWAEARIALQLIAETLSRQKIDFDLVFFSDGAELVKGVRSPAVAMTQFDKHEPKGGTNLMMALDVAYNRAQAVGRDTSWLVITDGKPDDSLATNMKFIGNRIANGKIVKKEHSLHMSFIGCGRNRSLEEFLLMLEGLDVPHKGMLDAIRESSCEGNSLIGTVMLLLGVDADEWQGRRE